MAASLCTVEYPAADPRVCTRRKIKAGTAHPAAGWNEFHTSGTMRDLRTAHEAAERDKPAQPASLAEFAHDLCSPLSALAISARCLRDEGTSDDQSNYIDTIIRISEHMLGMLRDALDRARIEAGRDVPRSETCDLELLVGDVADVSRPYAQAKDLEFIVRRDPACPRYVRTDASRLRRVLINVLDNAVKYTAQGSVTLTVDFAECRESERGRLIFEIRDTGIGIAPKDRVRIFECFVRGPSAAGTNGTGLGLTIASELVHWMGGTILVTSKPGTGSCFRIELPLGLVQDTHGDLPPATPVRPALPLEHLAALPFELRVELRDSLVALDVSRIHKAIQRIAEHNGTLGAILESHANRYALTGVFEAISLGL